MDRFRIRALENMLAINSLNSYNQQLTIAMLGKKLRIYLKGAEKRGKSEEVCQLRKRLAELEALSDSSLCC